jgi:hypothetical protein
MHWLTQLLKARASGSVLHSVQFDTNHCLRPYLDCRIVILLRAFYREEAIRHGGGIVCAEIVQAGGIRSVKVINKYERSMYAYDGTLIIPFKNAQYTVTFHSFERVPRVSATPW